MNGLTRSGGKRRASVQPEADSVIVPSFRLSIPELEVLHFLGYPKGRRPPERLDSLYRASLREANQLAAARGAWRNLPVSAAADVGLPAEEADGLVIGLVTIGAGIERRVSELLGEGEAARAIFLDAVGSAAAEEAARSLSVRILRGRSATREDAACRVSPGYGHWPLTAQKALFARLPHEALGVALNPSMMMVPRKSISFALWLGALGAPRAGLSGCDTCGLPDCRYRRTPRGGRSRSSREVTRR